ncbi:putative reverse transcriptase domain, ribonuclease H-like domain, aspartic peptidase domain protein [Tanacetum coccineum]
MDPNSSLGKICLGDDVIVISSDQVEGSGYWNSLEYQDTAVTFDGEVNLAFDENLISNEFAVKLFLDYEVKKGKKLVKKELIIALKGDLYFVKFIINPEEYDFEPGVILGRSFLRLAQGVVDFGNGVITIYPEPDPFEEDSEKTCKSSVDWDQLLDFNFDDVPKPSSSTRRHLTQEEAAKEELAIKISQRYALLEEERPVELDGKTVKEDKEAVKRIIGEALKEKDDPGAFMFPIRLEGKVNENALADTGSDINTMPYRVFETLGREDMKKVDRGITMINHTQAEAMGKLSNVLSQVGVTTITAKFLILYIPIDRDAPIVVGRGFLHTMGSILNASERIFSTIDGICHQTFCATRFDVLRTAESDSDHEEEYTSRTHEEEAGLSQSKRPRQHEIVEELVREAESEEEVFTSVAWIRAFNINEPIYAEFCHEFYSTYEFDETLLEFARRLGLYQAVELEEDGFNVYFEGGFRNDDNFNAQDYWLSISREENLSLSMSHTSTIRNPILRVIHKMITYGLCQRTTGLGDCEMDEEERSWDLERESNLLWDLETTTLRDLIDSDGKLIPEDPQLECIHIHFGGYHGVFEHMAGVYSVPLQGAYNPPGYAQPQYDQYYQQYPPPPPPQQQQDDDE